METTYLRKVRGSVILAVPLASMKSLHPVLRSGRRRRSPETFLLRRPGGIVRLSGSMTNKPEINMKSPFPGMDPYIEECGLWGDFHSHLIEKIGEKLADAAPEHYLVRTGERSYIVLVESEGKQSYGFLPDVRIDAPRRGKKASKKGSTALAEPAGDVEPITMRAFIQEEHREAFIEIYEANPAQRLVTSIEVLSPSNKRPGTEGWKLYQRKRQSLLLADVNLVEIDLLRAGQRMPMFDPWPDSPYTLLVARGGPNFAGPGRRIICVRCQTFRCRS